jgi:hypothetical protein
MMSGMSIETCWAFNKLWNNKFYYKLHLVGYFCYFILQCTDPWISIFNCLFSEHSSNMLPKILRFCFLAFCVDVFSYVLRIVRVGAATRGGQNFSGSKISVIHEEMKYQHVLSGLATHVFRKCTVLILGKGKEIPLQAWTGLESSRRLTLPNVQTNSTWRW